MIPSANLLLERRQHGGSMGLSDRELVIPDGSDI
jgi:hypothetical protein